MQMRNEVTPGGCPGVHDSNEAETHVGRDAEWRGYQGGCQPLIVGRSRKGTRGRGGGHGMGLMDQGGGLRGLGGDDVEVEMGRRQHQRMYKDNTRLSLWE